MNTLTIILGAAWLLTLGLLIRSLFRQAGIQDAIKETSDLAKSQLKLWEEFGQHLDEGVALLNEKGIIMYANGAFSRIVEWPSRSSFHQELGAVLQLQDEEAQPAELVASSGKDPVYAIGRDGTRTSVYGAIRDLNQPEGYQVVVLRDATAEEAEKELRHRLINLSSFELRAPVTAMKGYASMLLDGDAGKLPKEATSYVQPIFESTDKLLQIIDDMAHVEALSTKKAEAQQKEVDLVSFLQSQEASWQKMAISAERKLVLKAPELAVQLRIDAEQLSRLVSMLINTAARTALADTPVTLTAVQSPRTLDIQISNQGSPLPKASQANVFDYVGGRGLDEGIGYYVAKQIIESHHAFVTVKTQSDGNLFVLSLPKDQPKKVTEAAPPAPSETIADATPEPPPDLATEVQQQLPDEPVAPTESPLFGGSSDLSGDPIQKGTLESPPTSIGTEGEVITPTANPDPASELVEANPAPAPKPAEPATSEPSTTPPASGRRIPVTGKKITGDVAPKKVT